MPDTAPWVLRAAITGVLAGGLSGLFGVGGGILIVPGLVLLVRMEQRDAHATSLAAIVPIAVAGAIGFALNDAVDWAAAVPLAIGSILGALSGAGFLRRAPEQALRLGFAAILVLTAIELFLGPTGDGRGGITIAFVTSLVLLGAAAGILAGLFGVGGGVVVVPALVLLYAIPDVVAKGTSLAVIVPTALAGTWRNRTLARLDVAAVVGGFGVAVAFAAARVALDLDPNVSSALFAALLIGLAVRLVLQRR